MSVKEQYWKYSLITIILGLGLILFIKIGIRRKEKQSST